MVSLALGWMIGTGIALLIIGSAPIFTGVTLILFGVLGFIEYIGRV